MDKLIAGALKFEAEIFAEQAGFFTELAKGQTPRVLFIACSDSRVDANLLTQTRPGELFVCRNAGNIVPPHMHQAGGITASIEYAVAILRVRHIVICGHTDCGAMKGALERESLRHLTHVHDWLGHAEAAVRILEEEGTELDAAARLERVTELNVLAQLQNLRTHPYVAAKVATGKLGLHGWVYEIATGRVRAHDPESGRFRLLSELA